MAMKRKSIVIIGAGVSGLTAGIYAEQSGYHAIILEKNPSVGGLCTGWYRKGNYIDGCIHWLTGTNKNTELYSMWSNVGAIDKDTNIVKLDTWGVFEYQGVKVPFYRDLDKAEKAWLEISPIDKKEIHHFFKMVRDIMTVELPLGAPALMLPFTRILKLGFDVLKVWPSYLLTMKMSCEKYAKRFKSPAIRWAITHAQPGAGNLYCMLFCYGTIAGNNGDIPEGGSKPMVERMKNRFLSLGGTLKLNASVNHLLTKNGTAVGVVLDNGDKVYGDYVVSALDPNYTMNKLLLNQYKHPQLDKRFFDMKNHPAPSCCVLAFRGKLIDMPNPYSFECEPFYVGGTLINHLTLRSFAYDKNTYVKDGKCVYELLIDQYSENYHYWNTLYHENKTLYNKKKSDLATAVKGRILDKFPAFDGELEVLDVFTPKTLNRYTNASRGAYMGFLFTPKSPMFTFNGRVNGLKNFIMAGQWAQCPGGLPLALASGRFAIQRIEKIDRSKYVVASGKMLPSKTSF